MSSRTEIDIQNLLEKVDAGERLLLLDVRNDDEFEHWKIEGRQNINIAHVPYFDFIEDEESAVNRIPKSEGEIIVVCAKGGSSEMVADLLRSSGFSARNLVGGMIEYGQYLQPVRVPTRGEEQALEIWQFNRRGKGCLSYAVISGDEAIVVDASRSIGVYEAFLSKCAKRLSHVLDTHIHADHISGGLALAARHGVKYSVSAGAGDESSQSVFPLKDGDVVRLGHTGIRVIATPGHTPGSVCYLAGQRHLLSGDTLFTKSIGRPDLGGHVTEWSQDLFKSLHERLSFLPDNVIVLPAHYSDLSEIDAEGVVCRPLGELRKATAEFQIPDVASFINAMKAAVHTPPAEYGNIIAANSGSGTAGVDPDRATQWELGKNQCAASARR